MISKLPQSILEKATRIYENQEEAPKSPGTYSAQGNPDLCAAASIAAAKVEDSKGVEARITFSQKILDQNDKEAVHQIFVEAGWGAKLSQVIMRVNDNFPEKERRTLVLELLSS